VYVYFRTDNIEIKVFIKKPCKNSRLALY